MKARELLSAQSTHRPFDPSTALKTGLPSAGEFSMPGGTAGSGFAAGRHTSSMKRERSTNEAVQIGVISDTHGLLRPEAVEALAGVDLIVHAGDIDAPAVIETLKQTAPVHAVRGNMDFGPLIGGLSETVVVEAGGRTFYVLHDLHRLDLDPAAAGFDAVIFGHSHRPHLEKKSGVLYVNPGSAGPRRFGKPVSVARITVDNGRLSARIVELDV